MFKQMRGVIKKDDDIDSYLAKTISTPENNEDNQYYPRVSRGPRERVKAIALEALKQKDLNHGRNLLMYAAYEGSLTSFNSLIKVIGKKVRNWRLSINTVLVVIMAVYKINLLYNLSMRISLSIYDHLITRFV